MSHKLNVRNHKPIAITPGEPAGIGPDIVLQLATQQLPAPIIVIADLQLLKERAIQLNLNLQFVPVAHNLDLNIKVHQPGILPVLPVALKVPCRVGQLNPANAAYVIETLRLATRACLVKQCAALVTAPVHKGIINEAGFSFTGHTEFLAEITQAPLPVMMLVANQLRVALVTTHLPLAKVAAAITPASVEQTLRILHTDLVQRFKVVQPRILVCGLNPHAGENGHMGREEIDIIKPILTKLAAEGMQVVGPLPADTIFLPKYVERSDAILAMYHDQGLPVVKYSDFEHAVNVTLGLPIVRTSVDHGTALELAGTGKASTGSLLAALKMAYSLV